jgi:isopenicillin N synthase-like dioxygenase
VAQAKVIKMSETFSSVPQVDYSRLNNPSTRDDELKKLRDAIFVVGFLYLTNTGLEVGTFLRSKFMNNH